MKTFTLYRKTLVYAWLKFALCFVSALIALILFLLLHIGLSAIGEGPASTGLILWFILCPFIYPMAKYFFGHRIIAGHLYAIQEALRTEHLPVDLLKAADIEVLDLFPTFAHYKAKELEAANSVKELYRRIFDSVESSRGATPPNEGMKKTVIKEAAIYLSFITSACVAQIFAKPAQMQEKTLAHSVGVFFRNRQVFLVDTYRITRKILLSVAIIGVILIALCITLTLLVTDATVITVILGAILGMILTAGIKNAFIDPIYLIKTMKVFALADKTDEDSPESYTKMAVLSPAYAKLWQKVSGEIVDLSIDAETSITQKQEEI